MHNCRFEVQNVANSMQIRDFSSKCSKWHANQRFWLQNAANSKENCPKLKNKNKMETTNPKVYTFYGDGSTIIIFSAIGSDGRSRAVSPKYLALPKILTLEIQDRQTFLHTNSVTHRHFYTQMLLHTAVLKQRSFYTQAPLHTDVFTHKPLYTQAPSHTDIFTHRRFVTQKL